MDAKGHKVVSQLRDAARAGAPALLARVELVREGRLEPFLSSPSLSSAELQWRGVALENHTVPAGFIHRHEHPEPFIEMVLDGNASYEVSQRRGHTRRYISQPGTIFLLPRGSEHEVNWLQETQQILLALKPCLLSNALGEAVHESNIELREHWDLNDRHISTLLMEMRADLEDGSPAGPLYGDSLANSLALYLLKRYSNVTPRLERYRGGMSRSRLNHVLEYVNANLSEKLELGVLANVAGVNLYHFARAFKQSTGESPHQYVLRRRIEKAKEYLVHSQMSVIEASARTGFVDQSHFSKVFRRLVGVAPSKYRNSV
jgi:AraC family transcriptional regulator